MISWKHVLTLHCEKQVHSARSTFHLFCLRTLGLFLDHCSHLASRWDNTQVHSCSSNSPPRDEAKAGTPRFYPNHPPTATHSMLQQHDLLPLLQTPIFSLCKDNCSRSLRSQLSGHHLSAASSDPGQIISPTCVSSKHPFLCDSYYHNVYYTYVYL